MTTRWFAKSLVLILATFVALAACELILRFVWHNPYHYESPDHLLKPMMHHARTDHRYSRALLDSEKSRVRLRTDSRSYILPSFQYGDPDVTVAFLGGSTTECIAVLEDIRFPAVGSNTSLTPPSVSSMSLNPVRPTLFPSAWMLNSGEPGSDPPIRFGPR